MAEGFAKFYGKDIIEVYSAGSKPLGKIDLVAVKVMQEVGIDISSQKSKSFDELPINKFDYVITLGCHDSCPFVPAEKHIDWQIEDPKEGSITFFRKIRDSIKNKVERLVKDLS